MASNAEAVLDLVVNGKSFFSDLDTAEKRSKALSSTFSQVGSQIDAFAQSMTGVGTNFEGLSGRISGVTASLGPAIAGFISMGAVAVTATAAVGGALFGLAQRAAKVGAELDDMSDTSGIAVNRLSDIRFAAEVTGTSLETINNAIFKFQERLGQNNAEVAKGLSRIGQSFESISALEPDQQFIKIASGINEIVDPATRAAAAVEIFGKQGKELLPLLTKDLQGLIEKSQLLGFTWTAEDAKAAEAFEEKSNELRLTLSNLATVIGKDLLPAFNAALDISNWTLAKLLAYGPPAQILDGFQRIKDFAMAMQFLFDERFGTIKPPTPASPDLFGGKTQAAAGMKATTDAMADQTVKTADLAEHLRELSKVSKPLTAEQDALARRMLAAGDSAKVAAGFLGVSEGAVKKLDDSIKAGIKSAEAFIEAWKKFQQLQIDKTVARMAEQAERTKVLNKNAFTIDLDKAIEENDRWQREVQATADAYAFLDVQTTDLADDLTDHLIPGMATLGKHTHDMTEESHSLEAALKKLTSGEFKKGFIELDAAISQMVSGISIGVNILLDIFNKLMNKFVEVVENVLAFVGNAILEGFGKIFDFFVDSIGAVQAAANAAAKMADDLKAEKEAAEDLDATIKKYKFTIEELGPALQRQRLDEQAQEIFHDWKILAAAGVNMLAIMRELGTNVQELVTNALKFHLELPEALRPLIQQMIEAGQLTDELGNKITNIDRLHFSQTMTQGFAAVVAAVDRLTAAILRTVRAVGSLNTAASAAARAAAAAAAAAQSGSSSSGNTGEPPVREAFGDYLHLVRPTQFLAAESGREDVVFGGAGRDLARDVAMELARLHPSATHAGATAGPAIIQLVVDSKVVAHAAMDGIHAGGEPRSKFDKLVGRLR